MQEKNKYFLIKFPPLAFIVALTILFFYPILFQGKTFYAFDTLFQYLPWSSSAPNFQAHNTLITDPVNVFYPMYHLFKEAVQSQGWCFWNSSNFCGTPTGIPENPISFILYYFFPLTVA